LTSNPGQFAIKLIVSIVANLAAAWKGVIWQVSMGNN
jgi:hypothetical protein